MMTDAIFALIMTCAPMVAPSTMASVITIESSGNPYAIGVVKGRLVRQPKNKEEAIATAQMLESYGMNYSVGTAQVNKHNFKKYGLTLETAFDPCTNINAGAKILEACYLSSQKTARNQNENAHLARAFSCYYSGRLDSTVGHQYANKVFATHRNGKSAPQKRNKNVVKN